MNELYTDIIVQHSQSPKYRGELSQCTCSAGGENPLCGDAITVYAEMAEGRVVRVGFKDRSCAIVTASADMMAGALRGKTVAEAREIAEGFCAAVTGNGEVTDSTLLPLMGVREFPMRIKCATLPWHAFLTATHDA